METVAFIRARAQENRRWGAERIRGARLTLGIHVRKGTILKHRRRARPPRQSGQTWATFWHHHAAQLWACDFIPGTALCFRSICAFVLVEHASRRVRPVGVTRHPPDAWVAPQRREATPFGTAPRVLIQDNDATYGPPCDRMAEGRTIDLLATPYQAPRANARCARFIGSVRRACLNHLLVLHEQHLRRILTAYVASFNDERPPQGLVQAIPAHDGGDPAAQDGGGPVACTSIRGG